MTVVSNMSPLHYLILIDCDRILPLLYEQVFAPPAVVNDLLARRPASPKPSPDPVSTVDYGV